MLIVNKKEGWVKGSYKELKRYYDRLYKKMQRRLDNTGGGTVYPGGGYNEPYKN